MAAWWRAWHPEAMADPARAGKDLALSDGEQAATLACQGSRVRMGIAPDLGTARELAGIG
jgi:hypothetical protein